MNKDLKLREYKQRLDDVILVESQHKSMSLEEWGLLQEKVLSEFYELEKTGKSPYLFNHYAAVSTVDGQTEEIIGKIGDTFEDIEKMCVEIFNKRPGQCFARIRPAEFQSKTHRISFFEKATVETFKTKALRDIDSARRSAKGQITTRTNYLNSAKYISDEIKRKKQEVKRKLKEEFKS